MPRDGEEAIAGCDRAALCRDLLPVEEAVRIALSLVRPIRESEPVPLSAVAGRFLARDLSAPRAMPFFDNAAMDGFAVRTGDLVGDGPFLLPVAAEVAAGRMPGPIPNAPVAVRIFTGAPVPDGFDAVVMQEDCAARDGLVRIAVAPQPGENLRRRGSDIARGALLLRAGTRLGARQIGLLAANGFASVDVRRRSRIALLSTGDELAGPGEKACEARIYDANRPMLSALFAEAGGEVVDCGVLPDELGRTADRLSGVAGTCDLVVTTGAVSVGGRDRLKDAFVLAGGRMVNWRVAMKPGKPVMFGRLGDTVVTGLPGNPLAAYVGAALFAVPQIAAMSRAEPGSFAIAQAVTARAWNRKSGRTEFVPVRRIGYDEVGLPLVDRIGEGGSAALLPLALADGIAVVPAERDRVEAGQRLSWHPFCSIPH